MPEAGSDTLTEPVETASHPAIEELHDSCIAHSEGVGNVAGGIVAYGAAVGTAAAGEFAAGGAVASTIAEDPPLAYGLDVASGVLLDPQVEAGVGAVSGEASKNVAETLWGDACDVAAQGLIASTDVIGTVMDGIESIGERVSEFFQGASNETPSYVDDKLGYDPAVEAAPTFESPHDEPVVTVEEAHGDSGFFGTPDAIPGAEGIVVEAPREEVTSDATTHEADSESHNAEGGWGGGFFGSSSSENESHDSAPSWGSGESSSPAVESGSHDSGGSGSPEGF